MLKKIFSWFENRIDPYPDAIEHIPAQNFWPFIKSCLIGIRPWLILLMVLTAGLGAFEAFLFQMMSTLIDWLVQETPATLWHHKKGPLLLILGVLLLSPLWVFLMSTIKFQTLQGAFPMRMRWRFHQILLNQSLSFYQDDFAGRISTKVMQTALAVRDVVMSCVDMFVYILIYFVTAAVILVQFDVYLLIPFVLWILIFAGVLVFFVPRLGETARRQADARSLMSGRITDAYTNITTVKLFSHSDREVNYAKGAMQEFLGTVHSQMRLVSQLETVSHTVNMSLIAAMGVLGIFLWQDHLISVGAVAASIALALRLNGMSHWLLWQSAMLFENIGTIRDGLNTLSKPQVIQDVPDAKILTVSQGDIQFKHVGFNYPDGKNLFADLNLHIKPGEKIGLVGRSGAGKSTLVNLLLRFYDVQGGNIEIDGQDIKTVTQESLRSQIAMVTQDTSLLHRSVRENIIYGKENATEEEMRLAAHNAQADIFIEQLSDGKGRKAYDVYVGERGVKLSGGQRQRIAIARVMLKNAPILLLDEATSALDSEIETAIQDSLEQLMENKTVIAIAHRLSTIAAMDRLIVLDDGKILESGTHQELLDKKGIYAKLWTHQSGGFLPEIIS